MRFGFESIWMFSICAAIGLLAVGMLIIGKIAIRRLAMGLFIAAMICFSLAAGGLHWLQMQVGLVEVMVDLSASTRTAGYRNRVQLLARVKQLLGDSPFHITLFSAENHPDGGMVELPDIPGERTIFAPPAGHPVLLFSDGQFELPLVAAQVFSVIDPQLEQPDDAALDQLRLNEQIMTATVSRTKPKVEGKVRQIIWPDAATPPPTTQQTRIDVGRYSLSRAVGKVSPGQVLLTRLTGGDAWPENDSLTMMAPPTERLERWWVGANAPAGWRAFAAGNLPANFAEYLQTSVLVLQNQPAIALAGRERHIEKYLSEMGGSVVLIGGDHAYAAGGYSGTVLEQISPLASRPPTPKRHWMILVDGSGSMSQAGETDTLFESATAAARKVLATLPPKDTVSIGSFSEAIRWWATNQTVEDTARLQLPPKGLFPRGPTNLSKALLEISLSDLAKLPQSLLLVTDADASIADPDKLIRNLKFNHIALSIMAIGKGPGLDTLVRLSRETGGKVINSAKESDWADDLVKLGQAEAGDEIVHKPMQVKYDAMFSGLSRSVDQWNLTYIKSKAVALANGKSGDKVDDAVQPAARWQFGSGQVAAIGYAMSTDEGVVIADAMARKPVDPQFKVSIHSGRQVEILVIAKDPVKAVHINNLNLIAHLRDATLDESAIESIAIPQVAPGRYELHRPAPRAAMILSITAGDQILQQLPIAARYAPEFDAIGNNHETLHELARRTHGKVIDVRDTRPITIEWPHTKTPIGSWFAILGAVLLAAAVIGYRRVPVR